jgi:hypothetical protein
MTRRALPRHWIQRARIQAEARARRAAFHVLLTDPRTAGRLDAMLADNARVDAEQLADVVPCIDVVIVPVSEGPVVDVALEPAPKGGGQ